MGEFEDCEFEDRRSWYIFKASLLSQTAFWIIFLGLIVLYPSSVYIFSAYASIFFTMLMVILGLWFGYCSKLDLAVVLLGLLIVNLIAFGVLAILTMMRIFGQPPLMLELLSVITLVAEGVAGYNVGVDLKELLRQS